MKKGVSELGTRKELLERSRCLMDVIILRGEEARLPDNRLEERSSCSKDVKFEKHHGKPPLMEFLEMSSTSRCLKLHRPVKLDRVINFAMSSSRKWAELCCVTYQ